VPRSSNNQCDAENKSELNGCNNVLIESQKDTQLGCGVSRMMASEPDM
jgi:hypothetical protein